MSIESRLKRLESLRAVVEDHIHWMIPNPLGGAMSPDPKTCDTCIATDFKSHYIILYNMRPDKNQKELSHARR